MRSKVLAAALATVLGASGYRYDFPRDHFNHPDFQTEWWYYTGNLQTQDHHRFGFELTFFRQAAQPLAGETGTWRADQIYLAHSALTDIDKGHFYHTERLNRAGPGIAGADFASRAYWNGNWHVRWKSLATAEQELQAVCDRFTLSLNLRPEKPLVIHRKASPYISFPRLTASGELKWNGQTLAVRGLAWMDHEFFNAPAGDGAGGWDWFSVQLDSHEEVMLYRFRANPALSSGTYIDANGVAHFLDSRQFSVSPGQLWKSPHSGAVYPVAWEIAIPSLDLQLSERPALKDQELFSANSVSPTYWEGAVTYKGRVRGRPVQGAGYLEMTGYARDARPILRAAPR
jgi:predicted secreted hydrolase